MTGTAQTRMLLTLQQVYEEVVTQGRDRPGAPEFATACERGDVRLAEITDPSLIEHVRQVPTDIPPISDVDMRAVALAIEQQVTLLTDDNGVCMLAIAHNVPVIGSIGILIRARLDGVIPALKPLLDQLIAARFHLNPKVTSTSRRYSTSVRTETHSHDCMSHALHH